MFIYAILIIMSALAVTEGDVISSIATAFNRLDENKDGSISKIEAENYFLKRHSITGLDELIEYYIAKFRLTDDDVDRLLATLIDLSNTAFFDEANIDGSLEV